MEHKHNKGTINDNALKAIVTDKMFRTRVVKAQKGKGSYKRQKFKASDFRGL